MTFNFTALRRHPIYFDFEQHAIEWLREHGVPAEDFLYNNTQRASLPLDCFFAETFRLDEPREVPYKLNELYEMYTTWCRDRGSAVAAARNGAFLQALHKFGFKRAEMWNRKRVWLGPPLANGDSQPISNLDAFFAETFDLDKPREVPYKLDELYEMYTAWCRNRGSAVTAARNGAFRAALRRLGFQRAATLYDKRIWLGPPLANSASQPLSHLQTFFAETFLLDEPREVPYKLDKLYSLYTDWCRTHGVKYPAARNGAFREALHRLGFRRAATWTNKRVWFGPPLKQSPSEVTQ
jgi:phage/plasmid-associated DNA primase